MAEDPQRNFRSAYYEKVGFRGVEEKKSLEIVLKDNPLDVEKLSTFSQRFPLPSMYRIHVWKVLLGILPPHSDSHTLVSRCRLQQFQDISSALTAMRFTHTHTPQTELYLRMFQLENQRLPRRSEPRPADDEEENFLAISRAMEEIVDDPVDCYWLVRCFVNQFKLKFGDSIPHLPKSLEHFLSQEDACLLAHLKASGSLHSLPYRLWFRRCFAGCLPESSLQRVWDKVISGSCKILVFVAVEILLSYKILLMGISHPDGVYNFLSNIWHVSAAAAGQHRRHRHQSHRPVAQALRDAHARGVRRQELDAQMCVCVCVYSSFIRFLYSRICTHCSGVTVRYTTCSSRLHKQIATEIHSLFHTFCSWNTRFF